MFPPDTTTTTGNFKADRRRIVPATPTAAAGSTRSLARSVMSRSPSAISSSVTVTMSSTSLRTWSNVRSPARFAARPSAIVDSSGRVTTSPASRLVPRVAAPAGSTPTIRIPGRSSLAAAATPEIRPPPPTGTTIVAASGTSSRISRAIVPWPAMTSGWSNGWIMTAPRRSANARAASYASS